MARRTGRDKSLAEVNAMLSQPPPDRARVLAKEQAWRQVIRLWESVEDPEGDYEICRTVGWAAWLRSGLLEDEVEIQHGVDLALRLLGQIWLDEPSDVPPSFLTEFGLQKLDPPQGPRELAELGGDRLSLYLEVGTSIADLDFAVFALRWAIFATPVGEPGRPGWLLNLSTALRQRWDKEALIDEAVEAAKEAVSAEGPGWHDPGFLWFNYARALMERLQLKEQPRDLDEAIAAYQKAICLPIVDDERTVMFHGALAQAAMLRYDHGGDVADLDQAVQARQAVVEHTPQGSPTRTESLLAWMVAMQQLHDLDPTRAEASDLIDAGSRVANALPPGHHWLGAVLDSLANAYSTRYASTGDAGDLDEAIRVGLQSLAQSSEDDPELGMSLSNLGASYADRFDLCGRPEDANEAIRFAREAVHALAADEMAQAEARSTLASALAARAEATGSRSDLDAAEFEVGLALGASGTSTATRARAHSNLSWIQRLRFDSTGDSAALDRSVEQARFAIALTPDAGPARAYRLSNLAGKLRTRAQRLDHVPDLDEAIELAREAAAISPEGHISRPYLYNTLATSLLARHGLVGSESDLFDAVMAQEFALQACPPGSTMERRVRGNRGRVLLAQFDATGDAEVLNEAIANFEQAVASSNPSDPERALHLVGLGESLARRGPAAGGAALDALSRAANESGAKPDVRAWAWRACAELHAKSEQWPACADAYANAIEQLQLVAPRWLQRTDQEYLVQSQPHIGTEGAAACLEAGDPPRAAELFEAGRAILFAQQLRSRPDLTMLAQARPDLAERFSDLNDALGHAISERKGAALTAVTSADLDNLVGNIRSVPGFERFARPPIALELLPPADGGVVVAVNVAASRGDAIVLTAEGIRTIELPGLIREAATERAQTYIDALDIITDPDTQDDAIQAAEATLRQTLSWLFEVVADPVLDSLGFTAAPEEGQPWPHVHWCPSGPLGVLPLHAAAHAHPSRGNAVLDRVISSTVPTIASAGGLTTPGRGSTSLPGQALVVTMPQTPGLDDLPEASGEASDLLDLLGERCVAVGLNGPSPTKSIVLDRLPHFQWAHFCCHGENLPSDPSSSRLLLADHEDHPLTVLDLMATELEEASLAFLSACTTARSGPSLPDEPVHLAAACQLAGYRHVVATLWPIADNLGRTLAAEFYRRIASPDVDWSGARSAVALHESVRMLRARYPEHPSLWGAHIHIGP